MKQAAVLFWPKLVSGWVWVDNYRCIRTGNGQGRGIGYGNSMGFGNHKRGGKGDGYAGDRKGGGTSYGHGNGWSK